MYRENSGKRLSAGTGSLFPESDSVSEVRENEPLPGGSASEATTPGELDDRFTIGEVVSALREEFPQLSVSKVRYLERRRLLELERTSGGYRLFTRGDIQLLRRILTLQENEYLPLEVIKQRIDSGIIQSNNVSEGESFESRPEGIPQSEIRAYEKDEFCEELGADRVFIEELISVGVIGRGKEGGRIILDSRDVEVARMAVEMSKYSIQPRHLRGIVAAVDREVAMFKQVLNPELRSGDEHRVSEAIDSARHLARVDARLKELIMAGSIDAMDTRDSR